MNNRNVKLTYVLGFLKNTWFWLGIWVFYYLRFTNYAGIGLLETIMIVTSTVMEIPTGAIADLLGKKFTLIIAFLFQALGNLGMGLVSTFPGLAISIVIACVGGAMYSGTAEALVYDSLKEEGEEGFYDKAIANIHTLQLVAMTISGAVGGFMYIIKPQLPFLMVGVANIIALLVCFFLKEPAIDTEKFSWSSYVIQTKQGFRQLFGRIEVRGFIFKILTVAVFLVVADEMVNDLLAVDFGFKEKQLGIFVSLVYLLGAGVSQLAPKIKKYIKTEDWFLVIGTITAFTFVISPLLGVILGGITITIRYVFRVIFYNYTSVAINKVTESKYRATTLSTFYMMQNIPYVLGAFGIGYVIDLISAKNVAFFMGITMFGLIFWKFRKQKRDVLSTNPRKDSY